LINLSASTKSTRTLLLFQRGLSPNVGVNLLIRTVTTSGSLETLSRIILDALSSFTAENRGHIGSIILLLIAQSFYHSIRFDLLLGPCSSINSVNV